jgi:hypothetical protein
MAVMRVMRPRWIQKFACFRKFAGLRAGLAHSAVLDVPSWLSAGLQLLDRASDDTRLRHGRRTTRQAVCICQRARCSSYKSLLDEHPASTPAQLQIDPRSRRSESAQGSDGEPRPS